MESLPEVYQCAHNMLTTHLTQLFITIWNTEMVPEVYKDAIIVHLYKHKVR